MIAKKKKQKSKITPRPYKIKAKEKYCKEE